MLVGYIFLRVTEGAEHSQLLLEFGGAQALLTTSKLPLLPPLSALALLPPLSALGLLLPLSALALLPPLSALSRLALGSPSRSGSLCLLNASFPA